VVNWRQYYSSDANICDGQLCAKGTRVMITNVLDSLAEGSSRDEILRSYPALKPEHIDAAIGYAAELAHEESLLPLRPSGDGAVQNADLLRKQGTMRRR
jgi:uncharacterized protein (DUF433 family)